MESTRKTLYKTFIMAIQDLRFSVKVLIFPFCEVHREGVGNQKGIDKVKVQVHQNLAQSFHHSLCVSFQSMICDHTGTVQGPY